MPQTTDFMMAMSLLMGTCVEPDYTNWNTKEVRAALAQRCIEHQYMDEREAPYVLSRKEDFESDVKMLQIRYRELKDIPKIEEAEWRIPMSREQISSLIQFNRSYAYHLRTELLWNPDRANVINTVIKENEFLYQVYDAAADAKSEFYYVTVRRKGLAKFKNILRQWDGNNEDETYNGIQPLPPHVPTWRFRERRR